MWWAADAPDRSAELPRLLPAIRLKPNEIQVRPIRAFAERLFTELAPPAAVLSAGFCCASHNSRLKAGETVGSRSARLSYVQERLERRLKALAVSSSDAELARTEVEHYVRSCERRVSSSAASTTCMSSPPPRRSMPSGLLAAGGHDVNWRSLRCLLQHLAPYNEALTKC